MGYNPSMRKLKLYLDTSVISHIEAPHKPTEEAATRLFYQFVREQNEDDGDEEFELIVSPVAICEIENCPEPKRSRLFSFLKGLQYTLLPESQKAIDLAEFYVDEGVLHSKHIRDMMHIAYAVLNDCDYIVSWNYKHFANIHVIARISAANRSRDLMPVNIVIPSFITGADGYANH